MRDIIIKAIRDAIESESASKIGATAFEGGEDGPKTVYLYVDIQELDLGVIADEILSQPIDWSPFEDDIDEAIQDSIDQDWTSRIAAKAVIRKLQELKIIPPAAPVFTIAEKDIPVRVYQLPPKLTAGFCFGGGNPISFLNVDWFNIPAGMQIPDREQLAAMIRSKGYYHPAARFMVMVDEPGEIFIIEKAV
ncbi:hypothetical protein CPT_Sansa94 [Caulobacter phage Sansa]|uniref:Uncharacterized protein n=1 Tax=Caulobacter phage Sansa TaxID=1675600 RepID=A0A0K1LMR3_9CAUD|nr:hypothetical protein HOR07_gp094 [Caulobacter phage Sansa]AKU43498.1 hypothetical protein CPT_Sansa94 [Caulobacter phage Sansa]